NFSISGPAPKPKPRSKVLSPVIKPRRPRRSKLLNENDVDDVVSLSSISSTSSGITNPAYTHEDQDFQETDLRSKNNLPPIPTKRHPPYSSDSDNTDNLGTSSHVFRADVHNSPAFIEKLESDSNDNWAVESEVKKLPMPKPRRRIETSSLDRSTDSSLSDIREVHKVTSDDPGMSTPRKDYMTIPMPAEKEEPEKDWGMSGNDPAQSTSFTSKWKKAAQTLISKPSLKLGKGKNKQKLDTRIEIENLDQTEPSNDNIEMLSYTKNPAKEDRRESLTEFRSDKKTKAMLQTQDDEEIERMKNMYGSPAKDRTEIGTPSKRERRRAEIQDAPEKCFGVMIHSCDLLPMDPNVVHPVVKITILNENGTCITKHKALRSHTEEISSPKNSRRKNEAEKENKKSRSYNKLKANASSKGSGSTTKFTPESVLPIMTQPCKLSYYLPTFAPNWNELVVFEEPFNYIVHPDSTAMLFFEIMDFLPTEGPHNGTTLFGDYRGNEEGWYKIAWGFLKLIGANGVRNVNRKLRLQLYKPEQLPAKLNAKVEVYHWWKLDRRHKIDSTLYVTVRGVVSPTNTAASLRTLLGMGKDDLNQAILESQIHSPKSSKNPGSTNELKRQPGQTDIQMPQWLRLDGQICKIPNKVIKSLPMSPIESLNLTISGNVQCVKFSPCGLKLATGLDTDELHTILVFDVPSGKLLRNIRCHHGLVYDLDWKIIDMKNVLVPNSYYLASASADTTATVWLLKNNSKESPKLVKKLLHPSFVYCIKIHPTKSNLVFTGCFDYAIRIWNIQKTSASQANVHESDTEIIPVIQLDQHESFVNCLTFNQLGTHLYSGDGSGLVFEWTTSSPSKKKSWKMERELTFRESGKNPINSLDLHPSGNRLLVHVRNSSIKVVDLSSFMVLNTLSGLVNEKLQIRSIFSPCGNLILSGSEDSTLCIWDADTGAILHLLTPENHRHCVVTSVDYHPHDYFVAIGLASTISEPNP
ncbi:unnamed protein product, partial [Allacma fusca]